MVISAGSALVPGPPSAILVAVNRVDPSDAEGTPTPDPTSRRAFLAGAGAAALVGIGAACTPGEDDTGADGSESTESTETAGDGIDHRAPTAPIAFRDRHQRGVLRAQAAAGLVASFDVAVSTPEELQEALQGLSVEIERIMGGQSTEDADEILPPPDSGILSAPPGTTSVVLAYGASLFDDRFGLADQRPTELIAMPQFFNDRLVQPELSHGDIALIISSDTQQGAVHALHQAVRATNRKLQLRWVQEGYNELLGPEANSVAPGRNLMGFRDGTSNLDTADDAVMDSHVWVQESDDEPAWATNGTYVAVRIVRILVEFWATAALVRQEQIVGRRRDSGAALGQDTEAEEPAFAANPDDQAVPLQSHIRRANPRTPGAGRILRRGFSYLNGVDGGVMDQGLLFLSYQRALTTGFLEVQSRLEGEPMEDYIKPVGGGLFFIPPGPGDDGWLGQSVFL